MNIFTSAKFKMYIRGIVLVDGRMVQGRALKAMKLMDARHVEHVQ